MRPGATPEEIALAPLELDKRLAVARQRVDTTSVGCEGAGSPSLLASDAVPAPQTDQRGAPP